MVGISLEEALDLLEQASRIDIKVEKLLLHAANGRILAKDYYAPISNPPFDRSPLDGYAFKAEDSSGASMDRPVTLKVKGIVYAGEYYEAEVNNQEAVRIMTGAPIPKGCDCVLRQEDTDEGEVEVQIYKALRPFDNYCFKGEDIKEGHLLLKAGEKLSPVKLGILASMGIQEVEVRQPLRMGLLCTGDELTPIGEDLRPGKIYNANEVMIQTKAMELGIQVQVLKMQQDTPEAVAKCLEEHWDEIDLMVTTGGVSVGKKDIMHDVINLLGAKRLFWRIAIQPGTPVLAACYKEKLLIGLSGNPFAALANFELIIRPVVAYLAQDEMLKPIHTTGIMENEFKKKSIKRRFIRAYFEDGKVKLNHNNHASGALYTMSLCNALIDIPAGSTGLDVGEEVKVILVDTRG